MDDVQRLKALCQAAEQARQVALAEDVTVSVDGAKAVAWKDDFFQPKRGIEIFFGKTWMFWYEPTIPYDSEDPAPEPFPVGMYEFTVVEAPEGVKINFKRVP